MRIINITAVSLLNVVLIFRYPNIYMYFYNLSPRARDQRSRDLPSDENKGLTL